MSYNFSCLSLNVRGINDFKKRKNLYRWLQKQKQKIFFLQETKSTPEKEKFWRAQWGGKVYFAHGKGKGPCKGVMILIKNDLDIEIKNVVKDENGRYVVIECVIDDMKLAFANLYAPNKQAEQVLFFRQVTNILDQIEKMLTV